MMLLKSHDSIFIKNLFCQSNIIYSAPIMIKIAVYQKDVES